VLFTDLVGSTELMARVGDVAFDALRGKHFAGLREALAAHGGVEVKNTGDGVMATFSSAVEALAAAVAMQQAAERQRLGGTPLSIRIGLSLGEVTLEGGDVFGTPVVEAARLVAAARAGQILATAVVQIVAGSRAPTSMNDVGYLELKGLAHPVAACEVSWEPAAVPTTLPLPALLASPGRVFVGRDGELDRLRQLWKEAAAGERRLGLLGGEPGIGKTRLAAELARSLQTEGAVVLAGRCDEDLGVPYQPFVEALRHYVSHAPEPCLGRHGGELARLVPELSQLVPGLPEPLRSDPETERYRLFDAITAWLGDVSAEAPVLLVLDDLQWAAKPTLLLLRHVLRSPEPLRLLVVATYRDTDIGRGHPLSELLADVRRIEGSERLPLIGLDVPGVAAYLEQAAGHELDDEGTELARVVWRETEGNPLFVSEVLRHLSESGTLERRDGRWVVTASAEDLGIPEGVRDVVGRRLSRLSEDANRVLACASVVGLEFEPAVVQGAGGFAEDTVLSALEESVTARLVAEVPGAVPRNRFSHAVVRATLYDELTAARRVALHRKVAQTIEAVHAGRLDDHLPALAHHWSRASAPAAETLRAVEYASRAGDRALAQLAHDEAVGYYRQALELLEEAAGPTDDAGRLELLISLGEAQRRAGDPAYRETLLQAAELARSCGDADALARAALANNRGFYSITGRVDAERVATLEAALDVIPDGDSVFRARLLANLAVELAWAPGPDVRLGIASEALAMARRLDDPLTLAHVLALRYPALPPFAPDQSQRDAAELEALARRLGDPALGFWAALQSALTALVLADRPGFDAKLGSAAEVAGELGQPFLAYLVAMAQSSQSRMAGRLGDAEGYARKAFDIAHNAGLPDASLVLGTQMFWIRYDQGQLDELVEPMARAAGRADPDPLTVAAFVVLLCELGRHDEARPLFDHLMADDLARLPLNIAALFGLTLAAEASAAVGHTRGAALLRQRLAPHEGLVAHVASAATGCVDHFLGLTAATLEDLDEAEAYFAAAERIHRRMGAPGWLARTQLEQARLLIARRQPERAREVLRRVVATAGDLGLAAVERRARALLA
jgi:tetratricopeptide (TPR) repeat protein